MAFAILFLGLFFGWSGKASAATYYAAKISGQWKYASATWPTGVSPNCSTNSINGCVATSSGNTLVIASGTYLTTDLAPASGITISSTSAILRGPLGIDPANSIHNNGALILDGTGLVFNILTITGNNAQVSNMTIQNNGPTYRMLSTSTGTGIVLSDVNFDAGAAATTVAIRASAETTFNRCQFKNYLPAANYGFVSVGTGIPIPNRAVKTVRADGTSMRESRSSPESCSQKTLTIQT